MNEQPQAEYGYIRHALANYFNVNVGHSEEEAIHHLARALWESPVYFHALVTELQAAQADESFRWSALLVECEVAHVASEEEAFAYSQKLLWEPCAAKLQRDQRESLQRDA